MADHLAGWARVSMSSPGYDLIMKILQMLACSPHDDCFGARYLTWLRAAASAKAILFWAMNLDLARYRVDVVTGVE